MRGVLATSSMGTPARMCVIEWALWTLLICREGPLDGGLPDLPVMFGVQRVCVTPTCMEGIVTSAVPIQVTASVGNGSYLCGTGYATQCLGCLYMYSCCTFFQY
jgi:hypothetical protein